MLHWNTTPRRIAFVQSYALSCVLWSPGHALGDDASLILCCPSFIRSGPFGIAMFFSSPFDVEGGSPSTRYTRQARFLYVEVFIHYAPFFFTSSRMQLRPLGSTVHCHVFPPGSRSRNNSLHLLSDRSACLSYLMSSLTFVLTTEWIPEISVPPSLISIYIVFDSH